MTSRCGSTALPVPTMLVSVTFAQFFKSPAFDRRGRFPSWPSSPCVYSDQLFGLIVLEAAADVVRPQEKIPMTSKSKLAAKLGAVAFVAATGLMAATGVTSPAFAANYSAAANGGGSAGYNHQVATDYRLKHHPKHHATPSKPQ